jgi:hypothetical protein
MDITFKLVEETTLTYRQADELLRDLPPLAIQHGAAAAVAAGVSPFGVLTELAAFVRDARHEW